MVAPKAATTKSVPSKKPRTARSAPTKPASARKSVSPAATAKKADKRARVRVVRDGFTMPEDDFALIAALKLRAMKAQRETKKSELLRAGLHVLMALDEATLVRELSRLRPLKVGRPKRAQ
jgi:hypothetical protein